MLFSPHRIAILKFLRCVINAPDSSSKNQNLDNKIKYTSYKDCAEQLAILNKVVNNSLNEYISIEESNILVDVVGLLTAILPEEILHVQSPYLQSEINYHFNEFSKKDNVYFFFKKSPTLQEIKEYSNKKAKKGEKQKSIPISRDYYEYNRLYDYKLFELNNNFAFEFAKRRYPAFYITEFLHAQRIIDNFFEYIIKLDESGFINSSKKVVWQLHVNIYTNILNKLLDSLENGESFFNIFDKFYKTDTYKLNSYEYKQRYEDFPVKDSTSFPLEKTHMKRISPMYRLPKLTPSLKWEVDVRINLALPEEQILDFIKHVKNKSGAKLNMVSENIFNNKQLSDNDIELIKQRGKNYKKKTDIREIVADILFVYDSLQLGIKNNIIALQLNNYYIQKEQKYFTQLSRQEQLDYFDIKTNKAKSNFLNLSKQEKLDMVEDITYRSTMDNIVTAYKKVALDLIENENFLSLIDG